MNPEPERTRYFRCAEYAVSSEWLLLRSSPFPSRAVLLLKCSGVLRVSVVSNVRVLLEQFAFFSDAPVSHLQAVCSPIISLSSSLFSNALAAVCRFAPLNFSNPIRSFCSLFPMFESSFAPFSHTSDFFPKFSCIFRAVCSFLNAPVTSKRFLFFLP